MSTVFQPAMLAPLRTEALLEVGWETVLKRNVYMAKDTASTGDDQFFRNAQIAHFATGLDWRKVFRNSLPVDSISLHELKVAELHKTNQRFILDVEQGFERLRPRLEDAIRNAPSQGAAIATIRREKEEFKEGINDKIDEFFSNIEGSVLQFPNEQSRQAAVNVWLESWQACQKAVAAVVTAIRDLADAVAKFFEDAWEWLEEAWKKAKSAFKRVKDFFRDLF